MHIIFSAIFGLLSSLAAASLQAAERPNILIMVADDLGWGDVGYHGNTQLDTPSLRVKRT